MKKERIKAVGAAINTFPLVDMLLHLLDTMSIAYP